MLLNLNFNIQLIELLIEPQIVAQLIILKIYQFFLGDIGYLYNRPSTK